MKRSRRKKLLDDWEIGIFSLSQCYSWLLSVSLQRHTDHYHYGHMMMAVILSHLQVTIGKERTRLGLLTLSETSSEYHCNKSLTDDMVLLFSKPAFQSLRFPKKSATGEIDFWRYKPAVCLLLPPVSPFGLEWTVTVKKKCQKSQQETLIFGGGAVVGNECTGLTAQKVHFYDPAISLQLKVLFSSRN